MGMYVPLEAENRAFVVSLKLKNFTTKLILK